MSRLFGRPRKPLIDAHRSFNSLCWYCGNQLPPSFTTVEKDGVNHRVHFGCRSPAEDIVRTGRLIEEQPDFGEPEFHGPIG